MKFCVKHFLKILFILSLGLGLNGIAKSTKSFTKNQKNFHRTSESTQNQFFLDIEEEEIEEEIDQTETKLSNFISEAGFIKLYPSFVFISSPLKKALVCFDNIKAYQISYYLVFHNLRL